MVIPFSMQGYEHADRILDGPFKERATPELEKNGLVHANNWEWSVGQVTKSKRPILSSDDVNPHSARDRSARRNDLTVAFGELIMAMRQGLVAVCGAHSVGAPS